MAFPFTGTSGPAVLAGDPFFNAAAGLAQGITGGGPAVSSSDLSAPAYAAMNSPFAVGAGASAGGGATSPWQWALLVLPFAALGMVLWLGRSR